MTEGAARPTGASFGDILVRLAGERPNLLVVAGEDPGPATWFAEIWPERVLTIPPVPTRTAVAEGIVRGGGDAIVVLEAEVTDLSVQPEAGIVMVTATAAHMAIAHRWALDVCQPGWPDDLPALLVGALGSPASAVLHLPVVPPEVTPSPGPTTFGAQRVLHRGPAGLVLGAGGTATLAREVATVLSRRQVEVTAMDLHTVTGGSGVDASLLAEHLLVGPLSTPRAAALTAVPVAGRDLTAVVDHIQRELRGS